MRTVMIGDTSVGKTSIITQLTQHRFHENEKSTVGAMFVLHQERVDGVAIDMQIWDTAGQEKFKSLGPIYYRGAVAGIVVFDWTSESSFTNVSEWIRAFSESAENDASIILVGNKSDLTEEFCVDSGEVERFAEEHGYRLYRTSAYSGQGIKELFNGVAEEIKLKMRQEMAKVNEVGLGELRNVRTSMADSSETTCC